jgi:putative endonuclease
MKEHIYYVYIMTNASRRSLYTGVCSRLTKRAWEHKSGICEGFTKQYRVTRLVYYETFRRIGYAIAREKQIKRWRREKKIRLIQSTNPGWKDLSDGWFDEPQGPSTPSPSPGSVAVARDDTSKKDAVPQTTNGLTK